jgi:hypothetical protein
MEPSSLPEDPSIYPSRVIVSKETSCEAAAAFYSTNTFVLEDLDLVEDFIGQDQY